MPTAIQPPMSGNQPRRISIVTAGLRLTVSRTKHGSDRFGVCEVCHNQVDTMYYAYVERWFSHPLRSAGEVSQGWTFYESPMPGLFAHHACIVQRAAALGITLPTDTSL